MLDYEALRADGVALTHSYVYTPHVVCARASALTGVYITNVGVLFISVIWPHNRC